MEYLFAELDLDRLSRHTGHSSRAAYSSPTLGVLAAHKVATARAPVLDLAAGGNLHSLAQPLMGFLFWH